MLEEVGEKVVHVSPNYTEDNLKNEDSLIVDETLRTKIITIYFKEEINNTGKRFVYSSDTGIQEIFINNEIELKTTKQYKRLISEIKIVTCSNRVETWEDVWCSCIAFLKEKQCPHVYLTLKILKKTNFINVPLEGQKRRGRPKNKSTKCGTLFFKNK